MKSRSSTFKQFTLGIEEEFQIVDSTTRELRSHVSEILEEGKTLLGEQVKPEMIQSMIEVGTGICKDIKEARTDITNLRGILSGLARQKGLEVSPPALIHSRIGRTRRLNFWSLSTMSLTTSARARRLSRSTQFLSAALQLTSSFKFGGIPATSKLSWTIWLK